MIFKDKHSVIHFETKLLQYCVRYETIHFSVEELVAAVLAAWQLLVLEESRTVCAHAVT